MNENDITAAVITDTGNSLRCEEIVVEINTIRRQAMTQMLYASVEIGRLLCEAKEKVAYGEWCGWLSANFDYSQSTANNLMRLYRAYGDAEQIDIFFADSDRMDIFGNLTPSQALALLPLPETERREFIENHDMTETSVRDIEAEIKARQAAEQRAESITDDYNAEAKRRAEAEERAAEAERRLTAETEKLNSEIAKAKAKAAAVKPVDLASEKKKLKEKLQAEFDKQLKTETDALNAKLTDAQKQNGELAAQIESAKKTAKEAADAEYIKQLTELEERAKATEAKLKIVGNAAVQRFGVHFELLQTEYNTLLSLIADIKREDAEQGNKFRSALKNIVAEMANKL